MFQLVQAAGADPVLLAAALFHDLGKALAGAEHPARGAALLEGIARSEVYLHLHLDAEFPIELTIYPERELRVRARSSTDGQPNPGGSGTQIVRQLRACAACVA